MPLPNPKILLSLRWFLLLHSPVSPLSFSWLLCVFGSPDHLNLPEFDSCGAGVGPPTGKRKRQHGNLFMVSLLCRYGDSTFHPRTSPLEGLPNFLPPAGRFTSLCPGFVGLWPLSPRHEESSLRWGR